MLNEDMLTPEQIKIRRLETAIEEFKKYDRQRKKYYADVCVKVGILEDANQELKDEIATLKNENVLAAKYDKVKKDRDHWHKLYQSLLKKWELNKIPLELLEKLADNQSLEYTKLVNFIENRKQYNKWIRTLREDFSNLIYSKLHDSSDTFKERLNKVFDNIESLI